MKMETGKLMLQTLSQVSFRKDVTSWEIAIHVQVRTVVVQKTKALAPS